MLYYLPLRKKITLFFVCFETGYHCVALAGLEYCVGQACLELSGLPTSVSQVPRLRCGLSHLTLLKIIETRFHVPIDGPGTNDIA